MTIMAAEAGAGAGAAGAESGAAAAAGGASKKAAATKTPQSTAGTSKEPAAKKTPGKDAAAAGAGGGGGSGRTKRTAKWAWSDGRKILIAEFLVCVVVLGLGTVVSPPDSKHDVPRAMIKGSALAGVFFILTLVSTAGGSARRTANAIGTLITASYVLTSADVHNIVSWAAGFFAKPEAGAAAGAGMSAPAAPAAGPEGTVQA